ncbi:thioesterase domain-containing protein [Streptomyces sp. IB2014 016-6]|uniref:thioesterase II family protein n=1 Tax=Streptomyces sp. IB2014 016-6 TaxID=2517818 RepID=UPI0011C9CEDA|nr:thioesterase domain-containing protein [Streptomyces sp. IB2014 016-6]TXL88186.1 thioesterase [Streptomyces sp. IB2014 016-6]
MSVDRPVRLYCFGHSAEGVFAFGDWAADVGPGVEPVPVLLPGCTQRRTEPRLTTRTGLLAEVLPLFTVPRPGPYALYGHGLGALAALTVVRALHEEGLPGPVFLGVGAWPPPLPPAELPDVRGATDTDLLHVLGGGRVVPPGSDEGIMLRAVLPVLRADLELAQDLREAAGRPWRAGPLTTPVLVVASEDDPPAAVDAADDWRQWTLGPVRSRTVPGRLLARGSGELPQLLGRACRVARRLLPESAPVG